RSSLTDPGAKINAGPPDATTCRSLSEVQTSSRISVRVMARRPEDGIVVELLFEEVAMGRMGRPFKIHRPDGNSGMSVTVSGLSWAGPIPVDRTCVCARWIS